MASSAGRPPPMSHVAAYYESRRAVPPPNLNSSNTNNYPHNYSPTISHPRPAHLNPNTSSPTVPYRTEPKRLGGSVSSRESGSSTASEVDQYLQKKSYQYSPQLERGRGLCPGKESARQSYQTSHNGLSLHRGSHIQSEMMEDNSTIFRYIQPEAEEEEVENDHALWILMWLSFLDPFHCMISAIYSIFAVFIIILLLPLRLCRQECSPSVTLVRMIGPIFRNHLQMIYAKSLEHAHTFEFSPACLVLIHVISPLISLGNAVAAWIVAVFWLFAIIMGNPDGTEKRDDGRATVLMLRDWWEKCLLYAVRK
ncbi:uncharacterized protein PV06_08518 [Exophiala oligosperma]|uniref:Uncharacterized protein n=2 Tax=Chaetothyriales TaxID=34395 RepID=A0A0D2AIL2_9EURO|nr:uncharacterized protein PV06_08518 [Exophiala oligosperma]KAJ9634028.1 hypothetical protein H2204_006576 [Knufia peltigerae]KIW39956.1 hypothetical protein PV06_08518 [Exophiala oligosperma]